MKTECKNPKDVIKWDICEVNKCFLNILTTIECSIPRKYFIVLILFLPLASSWDENILRLKIYNIEIVDEHDHHNDCQ